MGKKVRRNYIYIYIYISFFLAVANQVKINAALANAVAATNSTHVRHEVDSSEEEMERERPPNPTMLDFIVPSTEEASRIMEDLESQRREHAPQRAFGEGAERYSSVAQRAPGDGSVNLQTPMEHSQQQQQQQQQHNFGQPPASDTASHNFGQPIPSHVSSGPGYPPSGAPPSSCQSSYARMASFPPAPIVETWENNVLGRLQPIGPPPPIHNTAGGAAYMIAPTSPSGFVAAPDKIEFI